RQFSTLCNYLLYRKQELKRTLLYVMFTKNFIIKRQSFRPNTKKKEKILTAFTMLLLSGTETLIVRITSNSLRQIAQARKSLIWNVWWAAWYTKRIYSSTL